MSIIGPLPVTLTNNTLADATQVMTDLNFIQTQVNAGAAAIVGGNAFTGTQTINGAQVATLTDLSFSQSSTYSAGSIGLALQASIRATDSPYNADSTGTVPCDTAFAAAAATGKDIILPPGDYLLGSTITLAVNQRFIGQRGLTRIWKNANVPMFFIPTAGSRSGFVGITLNGNYIGPGFGSISGRPAAAASFTDTTDNIQVGIVGVEGPYFWVFDDCDSQYAGQHGINWIDGPSPFLRGYLAFNAGWGLINTQSQVVGGTAIDTHHATVTHIESSFNGNSTLTDGGGVYLRGCGHSVLNLKCFGNYGDGLAVNGYGQKVTCFVEQNGVVNSGFTAWASGQTIVTGNFRKNGYNLYVATTSGTTGATAPVHTSGAVSDGGVTWQYRRGLELRVETNSYDSNEVSILSIAGAYSVAGNNDVILPTQSNPGSLWARTNISSKRVQVTRATDYQNITGGGAFELLNLQPQVGGGNAQWELIGTNGSSTVHDVYVGNAAGNEIRLRGNGTGYFADIPVGGKPVEVSANYSLFGKSAGVGDTFYVDCTAGPITFTLGGNNLLPGRKIIIVKVDSSANAVTVTGSGTYNGTAFGSYTLTTQWSYTELNLRSTTGPAWWKKV